MTTTESEFARLALEVVPSLAANGLTILMSKMGKVFGGSKPEDRLKEQLTHSEHVLTILQKASATVGKHISDYDPAQLDEIRYFLASSELESMLQQIFAAKLIGPGVKAHLADVEKEFAISLASHLNVKFPSVDKFAAPLFDALLVTCEEALSLAVRNGSLEALDAKNTVRHSVLLEEIGSIKRTLDLLTSKPTIDIKEILAFEAQFRVLVAQRHGYITPPNLSNFKKFQIDDLYVANDFEPFLEKRDGYRPDRVIARDQFARCIYRTVVLGDPGAGKSTFSQKACFDLATRQDSGVLPARRLTPLLVILRDYGAEKKVRHVSILQFIEATSNSKYQIVPPHGAIEYLLLTGRAMVIFDGLDELIDSSYRREITADVESFCILYPGVSALITSRQVGYDQAPLAPKRFEAYQLPSASRHIESVNFPKNRFENMFTSGFLWMKISTILKGMRSRNLFLQKAK